MTWNFQLKQLTDYIEIQILTGSWCCWIVCFRSTVFAITTQGRPPNVHRLLVLTNQSTNSIRLCQRLRRVSLAIASTLRSVNHCLFIYLLRYLVVGWDLYNIVIHCWSVCEWAFVVCKWHSSNLVWTASYLIKSSCY